MKKVLSVLLVGLISIFFVPFNVNAKNISTLDIASSNNKISVSGTTENGVLAVAVLVYSGSDLVHMETCSSNNNKYSCELSKTFSLGKYTVKVADYNGGNYITKDIDITEKNPKTIDRILLYIGLCLISFLGLIGIGVYLTKRKLSK